MKSIRVCFREDDSLPKQPEIDWAVRGFTSRWWLGIVTPTWWKREQIGRERRGVRGERSGKWKETRKRNTLNQQKEKKKKKKGKKVGNEKLGENFCGKKKKICGESLSYRVFFFFFFDKAISLGFSLIIIIIIIKLT